VWPDSQGVGMGAPEAPVYAHAIRWHHAGMTVGSGWAASAWRGRAARAGCAGRGLPQKPTPWMPEHHGRSQGLPIDSGRTAAAGTMGRPERAPPTGAPARGGRGRARVGKASWTDVGSGGVASGVPSSRGPWHHHRGLTPTWRWFQARSMSNRRHSVGKGVITSPSPPL